MLGFDESGREVLFTAAITDTADDSQPLPNQEVNSIPRRKFPVARNPIIQNQQNINSAKDGNHRLIGLDVDHIYNAGTFRLVRIRYWKYRCVIK